MTDDEARELLEAPRVRIWNVQHTDILAEGRAIAVCFEPSVTLVDDEGQRHHHSLALPVEIAHHEWRPR